MEWFLVTPAATGRRVLVDSADVHAFNELRDGRAQMLLKDSPNMPIPLEERFDDVLAGLRGEPASAYMLHSGDIMPVDRTVRVDVFYVDRAPEFAVLADNVDWGNVTRYRKAT